MRASTSPDVIESMVEPSRLEQGFVCNQNAHWFAIRRIGPFWFNLNSKNSRPKLLSASRVCDYLTELRHQGCVVHIVRGVDDFGPGATLYQENWKQLPAPEKGTVYNESCWHPLDYLLPDGNLLELLSRSSGSGSKYLAPGRSKQKGIFRFMCCSAKNSGSTSGSAR